jgi:hypothetical protein
MKTMAVQTATDGLEYYDRADVDLVSSAQAGDNLAMEFLLNKYKNFVRIRANAAYRGSERINIQCATCGEDYRFNYERT